jgi:guanylate kinase
VPDANATQDLLLEIDVAGGRQVLEHTPEALVLFVDAPDDAELRRRLLGRGDAPDRAEQRVVEAARERDEAEALGYRRVVNDVLEEAIVEIRDLIDAARSSS